MRIALTAHTVRPQFLFVMEKKNIDGSCSYIMIIENTFGMHRV